MRTCPQLTREEEQVLARRFRDHGDIAARNRLGLPFLLGVRLRLALAGLAGGRIIRMASRRCANPTSPDSAVHTPWPSGPR